MVGKEAELFVFGELLRRGIVPYTPLVDVEGVDAVVRAADGEYREIQVKKVTRATSPRWFIVRRLRASQRLFILCVEPAPDNAVWVIPSLVFDKYATKSQNGDYDLNLDAKARGSERARKDILASYKNNWDLLTKCAEDLEDLIAMYESMAAPGEEAIALEHHTHRLTRDRKAAGSVS